MPQSFGTNPTGARTDRTLSHDAEFTGAGMPMNSDWNAHWDVATVVNDQGWFVDAYEYDPGFGGIPAGVLGDDSLFGSLAMPLDGGRGRR